jgi:hypothetical protein
MVTTRKFKTTSLRHVIMKNFGKITLNFPRAFNKTIYENINAFMNIRPIL